MSPSLRNAGIFSTGLLLILIWFYFPFLTGDQCFYRIDATCFFEPLCSYIGESLKHGRFPLWNPLSYCGMPQIAISSPSALYPPNWLFAVLPFSQTLALLLVAHQFIMGL